MNIGHGIREIRKAKGISQGWLALKTGMSQTAISQIENGMKWPKQKTLDKICKVLDTPEALIVLCSLKDDDIPKSKKVAYDNYFPFIKDMLLKILT